ncbi:MAG: hypothetical protein CL609_08835 [Anaerolineaceae bacterium]|nr:hypothetical protein [Anaerolineaceae bacterium]
MKIYQTASEVIGKSEVAVVVFTHGDHFYFDEQTGVGQSGNWVVDPEMVEGMDKIIVYYRADGDGTNHIFLGTYAGYYKSPEPRRYIIRFHSIKKVGTTPNNWFNFGNGSQSPVCYVAGK